MAAPRVVLVHGNPETPAIWGPLRASLEALGVTDVVASCPPGFGTPLPEGFGATAEEYAGWLASELVALGAEDRPVDLLGHDWGAGHVYRLVADRPELVRSWAADVAGLLHPSYRWHDAAVGWQTPDVGEEMVAGMVALPDADVAALFVGLGMTPDIAAEVASAVDDDMATAILALYRSAPEYVLQELGERLLVTLTTPGAPPGLVIGAEGDDYVPVELGEEMAARWAGDGAAVQTARLLGVGHWWMIEGPDAAARALAAFWESLAS